MVSFTPRPLYASGRTPNTHWMGDWERRPRAGLADMERGKILPLVGIEL
jgi:hypothetical protein